jgi:hypothetical protein
MERPTNTGGEVQPTLPPRDMELTSNINIVPGLSGINLNRLIPLTSLHFSVKQLYQFGAQMRL